MFTFITELNLFRKNFECNNTLLISSVIPILHRNKSTRHANSIRRVRSPGPRPCAHSRTKAIRLLITRGRRALANLSVGRKRASAVSLAACVTIEKQEALSLSHTLPPSPLSLSLPRIPCNQWALAAAARPARGLIRLYDVFFSFRLYSALASHIPGAASPFRSQQADIPPRRVVSPILSFFPLSLFFFPLSRGAYPASKYCRERIKRQSRSAAPITFGRS